MSGVYGPVSSIISAGANFGLTAYNNEMQRRQTREDREQNYIYNEMAANNADARTRGLYKSFYSPEALLKQYQEAGLSPSMMFGGTPGQGGMSGAQGSGTQGLQTPYMPVSLLEAAQAANLIALTDKTKAETKNVQEDTAGKQIVNEWNNMLKNAYSVEYEVTTSYLKDPESGESTMSIYDVAAKSSTFEEFENTIMKAADDKQKNLFRSEKGNSVIRQIYKASKELPTEISQLNYERTNAVFQQSVIDALKNNNFQEHNAKSIVAILKANVQTAELTEQQQSAWNNMLDKLGDGDMKDLMIVIGLMFNNAMMNYKLLPNITVKAK